MDQTENNGSYENRGFKGDTTEAAAVTSEGISYVWKNLSVSIGPDKPGDVEKGGCFGRSNGAESKQILKNMTGIAKPGEVLAIMGASGAGKTTFLNVLTFRNINKLKISGEMIVNGISLDREMLSSISAYVQQDDLFIGSLTVKEHLIFQARLRMHSHIPMSARLKRVEEVLDDLGLRKCENTQIGTPGRIKGISGGEMKRLSFASEVLTDPPLMFCDEPTSGLDSYMAQNVVQVLKQLAMKGKTIICTIHQPSSQVYSAFDKLLLMAEGQTAFLGEASQAMSFFSDLGYPCPLNFNPSDHFIQLLAVRPGKVEECKARIGQICDGYDKSEAAAKIEAATKAPMQDSKLMKAKSMVKKQSPYKASWGAQLSALLWRSWLSQIKDPMVLRVRLGTTMFVSLLFGLIYLQIDLNQDGIMDMNGALFLFITNMTFQNVFGVINSFCIEVPIFLREHFNGMYRTDTYFIAKNLVELPVFTLAPAAFACIVFWMVGFSNDIDRFLVFLAIMILVTHMACSFGYMVSCLASSVEIASAIGPVLIIPFMLFGGFFQNADSAPVYFIWLKYLSWFLYANEALAVNQWKDVENIACNYEYPRNATCVTHGNDVLKNLNFNPDYFVLDICMVAVLLVVFRVFAFLLLLRKTYPK